MPPIMASKKGTNMPPIVASKNGNKMPTFMATNINKYWLSKA